MFGNTKAFSGFAVDNLHNAREFYEGVLGIRVSEGHGNLTLHIAGGKGHVRLPEARLQPGHVHDPQLSSRRH